MQTMLGKEGLTLTWQEPFPETAICCRCGGEARVGFVTHEGMFIDDREGPHVCGLHANKGKGGYWLHDCCAVAIYFCRDCLEPTALYNQA